MASATSKEMEIKLTNVARASLGEPFQSAMAAAGVNVSVEFSLYIEKHNAKKIPPRIPWRDFFILRQQLKTGCH